MATIKIIPKDDKDKKDAEKKVKTDVEVKKDETKSNVEVEKDETKNKIVLPGDVLVESIDFLAGHGTYREGKKIYSKVLGLLKKKEHVISVIPFSGLYTPKAGDFIVGEIVYVGFSNWKVNFGCPYDATLPMSGIPEFIENGADLTKYYKRGNLIFAQVDSATKGMIIQLSLKDRKARKLFGGKVIEISSQKVPRLIGKSGTMISQIKDKTGCVINVGQNGRIWIKGDNEALATKAIMMVEKMSHKSGLTETISKFLDEETKKDVAGETKKK
ncbi:MAG: RNA-binding protein [Candidatus Aenigmarchaeota archaeon]|nr:RNA-binding protein [Candidatus Aenigmarchaeota archaeon]